MRREPNILLTGGTGRNTGKTTFVCTLIDRFRSTGINAIKITPHFHNLTEGLMILEENSGYRIYSETDSSTAKDTSRMLKAGAEMVILIQAKDDYYTEAFSSALKIVGDKKPVICESPSLRYHLEPGLFVMIRGDITNVASRKDSQQLISMADIVIDSREAFTGYFPEVRWTPTMGWENTL